MLASLSLLPQFLFVATLTVDHATMPLLETPPVLLYMVINPIFNKSIQYWSTNMSLEHKHIGAQCIKAPHPRMRRMFLNACSPCNHRLQPLWALMHTRHGVINLMSTSQILSHPLLMSLASCLSFCTVRHNLQHYQHNNGYQQCLRNVQKHIQGHNCIEATQFGIQCQCSGPTYTIHILIFGNVLQSTMGAPR